MSEYTKEPWSFDKNGNILAGEDVLLLGGIRTPMTAGPGMDEARANARRIVACVNAFAGLETEVIDNIVTLGETLLDRFELRNRQEKEIKAQRDELLSALEAAIECGMVPTSSAKEGGAMHYVRQAHVADQIRAAIAKAKGV